MALTKPIRWKSWSADGARIFGLRGAREVMEGTLDGSTPVRVIAELSDTIGRLVEVSPDGTALLATADRGLRAARLVRGATKPTHIIELVTEETPVIQARFSPDARSIVYVTDGLYVQPFPGPGRRQQIGPAARFPVWRGDSKEILYLRGAEEREVWSVAVSQTGGELTFSTPQR